MKMEQAASLRKAAPCWSLHGDQQLLDALQHLHQRIVSKCEETNSRLTEMTAALSNASVSLHNVNNRFMALSNSQFVESRVYDDDVEVKTETAQTQNPPESTQESELEILKSSLLKLEEMHEPVTILNDSDSESDSDAGDINARVVLKPKEIYSDRPLPHIIGSFAWKSKWHAGLLPNDSDSDSTGSKPGLQLDEYSDSEPESLGNIQTDAQRDNTISSSASELASSPAMPLAPAEVAAQLAKRLRTNMEHHQISSSATELASSPALPLAPAEVAAQLAKRLRTNTENHQPAEIETPPEPIVRKTYGPQKPAPGAIFPDEPPPLDAVSSSSNEDIFAELHRGPRGSLAGRQNSPHAGRQNIDIFATAKAPVDLFADDDDDEDDIFSNKIIPQPVTSGKQKSTLFEDEPEPELFAEKPTVSESQKNEDSEQFKKPIGGISLFGAKNSETISAAILKRNQRQSPSSEDGSYNSDKPNTKTDVHDTKNIIPKTQSNKNTPKDIFDDLFAKSERLQKESAQSKLEVVKKPTEKKIDLFSDNLFDDVDDIFTTNIVKSNQNKKTDDLFAGDDLFANIAVNKSEPEKVSTKSSKSKETSIFDSDDDLFSEKPENTVMNTKKDLDKDKVKVKVKESLFDSEEDNDIFSSKTKTENHANIKTAPAKVNKAEKPETIDKKNVFEESDDDLFTNVKSKINDTQEVSSILKSNASNLALSPNLFDDEDEIFSPAQNDNDISKDERNIVSQNKEEKRTSEYPMVDNTDNVKLKIGEKPLKERENVADRDISSKQGSVDEDDWDTNDQNDEGKNKDSRAKTKSKRDEFNDLFKNITEDEEIFATVTPKNESEINIEGSKTSDVSKEDTNIFENKIESNVVSQIVDTQVTNVQTDTKESKVKNKHDLDEVQDKHEINRNTNENLNANRDQPDNMKNVDNNENTVTNIPGITKTVIPTKSHKDDSIYDVDLDFTYNDPVLSKSSQKINDLFDDTNTPESKPKSDIFSDIFNDQPPIFEKPKEPKKSRNVNALFDDDSDDEALFFKKNDVILHDHPEEFSPDVSGVRFDIFHDEPPAIDVDFTRKGIKNDNDEFQTAEHEDKNKINTDHVDSKHETADELFGENLKERISNESENKINVLDKTSKQREQTKEVHDEQKDSDNIDCTEPKKIGKLKPMNLNINVNTLLPGASPKKVQKFEQSDGLTNKVTAKSSEELRTTDSLEVENKPQLVKSVSFENEPDGTILDNRISKERPKIQVKRRPSTRRARREAVKKSGIDFGEDSTDNSSSIDDYKAPTIDITKNSTDKEQSIHDPDLNCSTNTVTANDHKQVTKDEQDTEDMSTVTDKKDQTLETNTKTDIEPSKLTNESITKPIDKNVNTAPIHSSTISHDSPIDTTEDIPKAKPKDPSQVKDVKSKVVYILNDEDIFNSKPEIKNNFNKQEESTIKVTECATNMSEKQVTIPTETINDSFNTKPKTKQILNIIDDDDDDDIFKSMINKVETNVKTTDKDKSVDDKNKDKSLADISLSQDSDDDIFRDFKNKTVSKNTDSRSKNIDSAPKPESKSSNTEPSSNSIPSKSKTSELKSKTTDQRTIFDDLSDSDDLFSKNKKETKSKQKTSLFGSDSDEELFSGKKKDKKDKQIGEKQLKSSLSDKQQPVKKVDIKSGSLFGDDDDDDLFSSSSKTKSVLESKPSFTARSRSPKPTQPVFDDPLSLFEEQD